VGTCLFVYFFFLSIGFGQVAEGNLAVRSRNSSSPLSWFVIVQDARRILTPDKTGPPRPVYSLRSEIHEIHSSQQLPNYTVRSNVNLRDLVGSRVVTIAGSRVVIIAPQHIYWRGSDLVPPLYSSSRNSKDSRPPRGRRRHQFSLAPGQDLGVSRPRCIPMKLSIEPFCLPAQCPMLIETHRQDLPVRKASNSVRPSCRVHWLNGLCSSLAANSENSSPWQRSTIGSEFLGTDQLQFQNCSLQLQYFQVLS